MEFLGILLPLYCMWKKHEIVDVKAKNHGDEGSSVGQVFWILDETGVQARIVNVLLDAH